MLTLVLELQPSTTGPCCRPAQAGGGKAGWVGGHLVYHQTSTHPVEPEEASPTSLVPQTTPALKEGTETEI